MSQPPVPSGADSGWEPSSSDLARQADPRVGTAYAVSVRTDADPVNRVAHPTVLTFRLRRVDPNGSELPPVAVEMRGPVLSGMIADGDLVQLPAPAPHGGALQLTTVTNLTTNSAVTAKSNLAPKGVRIALALILLIIFLAVFAVIIGGLVQMTTS